MTKKKSTVAEKRKRKPKPTQLSSFVGSKRQKKPKPDRKQLKAIYKSMINALPEARVNALIPAVNWYDAALDWVRDNDKKNIKLQTSKKLKLLTQIGKVRETSLNTLNVTKKEELLKKLIETFEKVLSGIVRTKSIASAYEKLRKVQKRLEKRADRLEKKYQDILNLLEDSLQPKNALGVTVQLKVGDIDKDRILSQDLRSLIYSRKYAQQMVATYKQQGLLPLAISEINWLSRVCAYKPNEEERGKFIIDLHKERETIFKMLSNLLDFCRSDSTIARRLVKAKRRKRRSK